MPPDPDDELARLLDLDLSLHAHDLDFYTNMARLTGGPVLELGAGSGRVALALAHDGIEVWGIDSSPAMLARAARKPRGESLRLQCADMRDFDLGQSFDFIYATFGTWHHLLTPEDQASCLQCVHRHLSPGGLFAFDVRPFEAADWDEGESVPLLHDWTRTLDETGETVLKFRAVRPDREARLQRELHIYDRIDHEGLVRRRTAEVDLRFSTRYEVEELLREAGLDVEHAYGDFDLAPYDEDSDYMIVVARRPGVAA
jgi:SAM-dependent methyltransferase